MLYPENRILLGVAPTRRDDLNFPPAACIRNKEPLLRRLETLDISHVSLEGVCPDGLLATLEDVEAAARHFRTAGIQALFVPNTAYGAEGPVALLAEALHVPMLLWAPPDREGTGADGKPQLGLYTIGKALRRMRIPFSFLGSHPLASDRFAEGLRTFIAAAHVVKEFRRAKVLQLGPRPESFWNVIVDEGALMERFRIPVFPIALPDVFDRYHEVAKKRAEEVTDIAHSLGMRLQVEVDASILDKSATAFLTFEELAQETRSTAIAVQCWHAFANYLGIWPCTAGALLTEKGLPVACEGDIHGAISCLLAQAASMGRAHPIFLDFDFGHPENPNAFNVHHCAMAPISCYPEKPRLTRRGNPPGNNYGGPIAGKLPAEGKVTLLRFDGDNGAYSVLLAEGKAVAGPEALSRGTYGWYEVEDWPRLEYLLATGPYTHHAVVIYDEIAPIVFEALKYIDGLSPDFAFESESRAAEAYLYAR